MQGLSVKSRIRQPQWFSFEEARANASHEETRSLLKAAELKRLERESARASAKSGWIDRRLYVRLARSEGRGFCQAGVWPFMHTYICVCVLYMCVRPVTPGK